MAGIKISVNKKIKEKELLPPVTLVFLVSGVLGILLLFRSPSANDYQTWLVLPFGAVLCWGLWFTYNRYRFIFWCLTAAAAIGIIAASYLFAEDIWRQGVHIMRLLFSDAAQETMDMTVTAMLLAVMVSFALFMMECPGRSHALLYLVTTALLLFAPLIDIKANIETAFLLILFQLAFWSVSSVTRDNPRTLLFTSRRLRLAGRSALALSIVLSAAFLAALPLVAANSAGFFESVYQAEGFIYRSLDNITGQSEKLVTGGAINNGNNYPTGTPHIELTASKQPTEPIYLRGFSGGEYIGGSWRETDDGGMIAYFSDRYGWEFSVLWNAVFYMEDDECYPFEDDDPDDPSIILSVRHINGDYSNYYTPYYSRIYNTIEWYNMQSEEDYQPWQDSFASYHMEENAGYGFRYYEQKDMEGFFERLGEKYGDPVYMNNAIREIYRSEVTRAYTSVPKQLVPRLTQLVDENPLDGLDEITAFIIYTLHSNAEYSLTPGWTPWGKDIADYFLFERKAGYCQHFALCGALMYRLYGVPARYATGYRADPSDFSYNDDGTYGAVLTDADAHAWVEIFLEDYGWTPVEVTPSGGQPLSFYPGLSGFRLNIIWQQNGWSSASNLASAQELQLSDQSDITDIFSGIELSFDGVSVANAVIIGSVLFVLMLPLLVRLRRKRLLKKYGRGGCRVMFDRLTGALHFGGVLPDMDGSEEDFAVRLSKEIDGISAEETEAFVAAVNKAAFGSSPVSEEEERLAGNVYGRAADYIYNRLRLPKKLIFKFIKAYI